MSRILPIELKEIVSSTLTGTYQNFGTALANPAIKIQAFNTSDQDAYLTFNGTTNNMRIPAGGSITLDESTLYFRGVDQEYYLPRGTQLQIKQVTAPGTLGAIICHVVTRVLA